MGWTLYPAYLCTSVETERDVAQHYSNSPVGTLLTHPLEKQMMPENGIKIMLNTTKWENGECEKLLKILENFVDNFINICQPKSEEHLLHLSGTILHGIHTVFKPPALTKMTTQTQYQRYNCIRAKAYGKQERKF